MDVLIYPLIAFRIGRKAFFLYGFAKNSQANITRQELIALRRLSDELLGYGETALNAALKAGQLIELENQDE